MKEEMEKGTPIVKVDQPFLIEKEGELIPMLITGVFLRAEKSMVTGPDLYWWHLEATSNGAPIPIEEDTEDGNR
jgi:hypothetical protein